MSEEIKIDLQLNCVLDQLEDSLTTSLLKSYNYKELQNILVKAEQPINAKVLERLLTVCVHDLKDNIQHAPCALSIISAALVKIQSEKYTDIPLPDLLPSALAIVNLLRVIMVTQVKYEALPVQSFELLLLSYPDKTLVDIVTHYTSDMIDMIETCISLTFEDKQKPLYIIDSLVFKFLIKLFKILPHDSKEEFAKQGLTVWFSKVIPRAMALTKVKFEVNTYTEMLEMLTDSLIHIDYTDNPHWIIMLECIFNPMKYPAVMKDFLESKNDWHRLWIIFIRLLKNQLTKVTKVSKSTGSPINSMLPVVELAFKLDPKSRCQAFQCWNVLIDNFASELNDTPAHVYKRMKLLIVPLKSSNAKVEEIALAKLNTWWHLIRKFHSKMDTFTDMILIPFLHFCFGKMHASGRAIFSPGQFSDNMKNLCLQAFVEIAGHVDCQGCVTLPKLKSKLISAKVLVNNWNDWVYSLKTAIIIAAIEGNDLSKRQVTCLWKSFVMTIGEMQENNIRKDLFDELLAIIHQLRQTNAMNDKLADISFNILIGSLFDDEDKIRPLLKNKGDGVEPMHTILMMILNPSFNNFFSRTDSKELVSKLKPMTNLIMDGSLTSPDDILKWLFKDMLGNDNTLMLWTALAQSVCESKQDITKHNLRTMLLWPLRFLSECSKERSSAAWNTWLTLYNLVHSKLMKPSIDDEVLEILSTQQIDRTRIEFPLCATLAVLKIKLLQDGSTGCENLAEILEKIISDPIDYECIEKLFPILFDTSTIMADKVIKSLNVPLATHTINIVKIVLKLITQMFKRNNNANAALIFCGNLLKLLDDLFKIEGYSSLKQKLVEELLECLPFIVKNSSSQCNLLSILKSFLTDSNKLGQSLYQKTKAAIEAFDNSELDCYNDCVLNSESTTNEAAAIDAFNNSELEISGDDVQNAFNTTTSAFGTKIKETVDAIVNINIDDKNDNVQNISAKQNSIQNYITAPNNNELRKKSGSKEVKIVNTVVENGEEFAVVKSHWKFNPRKLTENQKEKLKRKREDIPALYQDLSQSQDEFKLTAWKSNDSQDTTTTSSKSTSMSNDVGASVILQNSPSTDVVPKIMENILSHNATEDTKFNKNVTRDKSNKQQQIIPVKGANSPRMALKDRVFRNVRNLIEKSSLHNDDKLKFENVTQIVNENVLKTPTTKTKVNANLINSAPSNITYERPSRVIKKPKKFDDSDLNVVKKRRRSQNSSPQPYVEKPNKSLKESDIQIETNKEGDKYPGIVTENCAAVVGNNEIQDLNCTIFSNKDTCKDKVHDTQMEITETLQNEEDKMCAEEKCEDKLEVDGNRIVAKEKEIQENTNIDTDVMVQRPKTKKLQISNEDQSTSNNTEVSAPNKRDTATPKPKNKEPNEEKSSVKKKRPRLEQELRIDMVPCLQIKSDKRTTRSMNVSSNVRRRSVGEKLSKLRSELKVDNKIKRKEKPCISSTQSTSITVGESQEKLSQSSVDLLMSEDIIESSQDSSITTISMKSPIFKKLPRIEIDKKINHIVKDRIFHFDTQQLLDESNNDIEPLSNTLSSDQESKEDIELPENKWVKDKTEVDLTENMDTQPVADKDGEIIVFNNDESPIVINSEDTCLELDTQEIAEADTQPLGAENETKLPVQSKERDSSLIELKDVTNQKPKGKKNVTSSPPNSQYLDIAVVNKKSNGACSPLNDEIQRKKDFLNDTIEISPIKTMSPLREKKSPSPETSSDYVVIKLTSPVQSNGEPFEKCDSPEIFTEDKVSPDKRDQSPPRVVVSVQNTSPSSSLSLKKNRPQLRPNGRAAHMLGLCAPDKLQAIMNSEISADYDESKKCGNINTAARRNLRILYNSVGEISEQHNASESEDSESFLKLKRSVPTADCSPVGPILKRKLADIVDESTISPASKRKRVSFHDPPVSTTVAVQKYIEPGVIRSPQSSTFKRLEKPMRTNMKSPKKLENVFKLDTILTKAVESFTEETSVASIDDTASSIDQTPAVEVVKTTDLNDTDPICSDLFDCTDPIDNIAAELSSPAMKALLIKELEGKVATIGDLAKMTELEVNRLCIKAPKVQVAKRVLTAYVSKKANTQCELNVIVDEPKLDLLATVPDTQQTASVEVQTNAVSTKNCEMQTVTIPVTLVHTQTDIVPTSHTMVQTDDSGNKSTHDVISSCLSERPDFIDQLGEQLEESTIQRIADSLSLNASVDLLTKKMTAPDLMNVLHQVLKKQTTLDPSNDKCENKNLSFLQTYMCERFDSKELILFCSQLLQKIHDKPV